MKRLLVTSASLLTLLVKHIANAFVSSSSSLSSRHFKYSPPMDVTKRIIPMDLTNDHYYLAGFSKRSLSIRHASKKEEGEVDLDEGEIFGPLLPLAKGINNGGWGVSYADLSPETPSTPAGQAFLITNACYAIAGLLLTLKGEVLLGILTEVAGVVSFIYHYTQLEFGKDRNEVRLALVIDYITAGMALITGTVYLAQMGITSIPMDCVIWGFLSILSLSLSWVWEFGIPYLFWHSIWHILSAYTGFLIGQAHLISS